MYGLVTSKTQL